MKRAGNLFPKGHNFRSHQNKTAFLSVFQATCLLLAVFSLSSCSLKYGSEVNVPETTPEFTFTDAEFSRYEGSQIKMKLKAQTLEQYKTDSTSYAQNASFATWDENGQEDTTGSCKIFGIDTKNEKYSMFREIHLESIANQISIIAENLKYDGKTRQLVSGANDMVYIQKDDIELTGSGFSASGISQSFSFTGSVNGTITTEENNK